MKCEVSVILPDDERRWVTVEVRSLFTAIVEYNHSVVAGDRRNEGFQRVTPGTEFEVRTEDGRQFRTTFDAFRRWASRQPLPPKPSPKKRY